MPSNTTITPEWHLPRHNPFRVDRLHQLAFRGRYGSASDLLHRFEQLNRRAAIIGPHGSGKTTLVEELCELLQTRGDSVCRLRLTSEFRSSASGNVSDWLRDSNTSSILVLDGAEQLHWLTRVKLIWRSRSHAGLLTTSHTPCWLPTLIETQTSTDLLRELIGELAPSFDLPPTLPKQLLDRYQGDIRACLRHLYDLAASGELQPTGYSGTTSA
ncbi:MAG: AAA family ATPase [Planctomycetaceae bacterium]|nr:AAA family ATPase [Planctomycetaceae bacterium]MCA9029598.1 AAA family ATPase [Planctomycetaceae bacterium]MCA9043420.1 AAA family ATPase [Planctomycetaceae bacterium]